MTHGGKVHLPPNCSWVQYLSRFTHNVHHRLIRVACTHASWGGSLWIVMCGCLCFRSHCLFMSGSPSEYCGIYMNAPFSLTVRSSVSTGSPWSTLILVLCRSFHPKSSGLTLLLFQNVSKLVNTERSCLCSTSKSDEHSWRSSTAQQRF